MSTFNVYCDESGHLAHDRQRVMALGAVWCPVGRARALSEAIRSVKKEHGLSPTMEVKWTKVSRAKVGFYLALVNLFMDDPDLHFRCLVVPDKAVLDHETYGHDHDTWYYKMYYSMLKAIIAPHDRFRIYLDIKDTRSAAKVRKLHDVLCSSLYDFNHQVIESVQTIRSHESEILQVTDLLIGAVRRANQAVEADTGKDALVRHLRERSGYSLNRSTLLMERKVNVFVWQPRGARG